MKYNEQLQFAASWILSVQNKDYGWGLNPRQASSLVNTAEALYVLNQANRLPSNIDLTVQFLVDAIKVHPEKRGKHLRYIAFGLVGLLNSGLAVTNPEIVNCIQVLESAQNVNGSWGHTYDINLAQESRLFPTFLAIWSLQMLESSLVSASINKGLTWLLSVQKSDFGWGFTESINERSNPACTAYALMVLHRERLSDGRVQNGRQWLIDHAAEWDKGQQVGEPVGGTDWYHCSITWAIHSLLDCGESVGSPLICRAVDHFSELFDKEAGGWRQSPNHVVNIRSIYWASVALERYCEQLDVSDVIKLGLDINQDQNLVKIGNQKFKIFLPKLILPILIVALSASCAIATALTYQSSTVSQPVYFEIRISEDVAKLVVTLLAAIGMFLLIVVRKQYKTSWLVIFGVILVTVVITTWFLKNSAFINVLGIVGTLVSILPFVFDAIRNRDQKSPR